MKAITYNAFDIHSIEPLSTEQQLFLRNNGFVVYSFDRQSWLENNQRHYNVEILIARDRDPIEKIVHACENLKMLFIVSTGVEKLPFELLRERHIQVANTGGVNSGIMSEYAMAYILARSAKVCENLLYQQQNYWKKFQCVESLNDKTLLIVGAGRTGQLIAKKANVFGMRCIGVKKHVQMVDGFEQVVGFTELNEMLPMADFIVCTIPLTTETMYLFDKNRFALMKPTATFINISRGKLIVENDLKNALENGIIGQAVLDVFETEPIASDSQLWKTKNLWITPHSSGRLENFMDEAIKCAVKNIKAYTNGMPLPNKVNLIDGY